MDERITNVARYNMLLSDELEELRQSCEQNAAAIADLRRMFDHAQAIGKAAEIMHGRFSDLYERLDNERNALAEKCKALREELNIARAAAQYRPN